MDTAGGRRFGPSSSMGLLSVHDQSVDAAQWTYYAPVWVKPRLRNSSVFGSPWALAIFALQLEHSSGRPHECSANIISFQLGSSESGDALLPFSPFAHAGQRTLSDVKYTTG
jgi:hypothetical protein